VKRKMSVFGKQERVNRIQLVQRSN
jgi:hypothetical protein